MSKIYVKNINKFIDILHHEDYLSKKFITIADQELDTIPNPIREIATAGRLRSDPIKQKTLDSLKDMDLIFSFSLSFLLTQDVKYLQRFIDFTNAWIQTLEPTGRPIDETHLSKIIFAFDLIEDYLDKAFVKLFYKFLEKLFHAHIKEYEKIKGLGIGINNHNSHRIKIITLAALLLDYSDYIDISIKMFKLQIENNIFEDGSTLDFHNRDSLDYHCYDIDPLLIAARSLSYDYENIYDYSNMKSGSLSKAVKFLIPYVKGEKAHSEFTNTQVAFDKKRAKAGESKFQEGRVWNPQEGLQTLSLSYYFTHEHLPLINSLSRSNSKYPNLDVVVAEATL